jgi:hypothetical protein
MTNYPVPSEVRYRIQTPNAAPRRIRVIALADDDTEIANCHAYSDVEFVRASELAALLQGLDSASGVNPDTLDRWLGSPDIVVFAGREGDDASAAANAARAYRSRGVTVSVVISPSGNKAHLTADSLRPYATMMVLPTRAGYLDDLLSALGAVD